MNRHGNTSLPVKRLFGVKIGETMVLNRPRSLWGQTLYLVATRSPAGEHVILATHHAPHDALADYNLEKVNQVYLTFTTLRA